MLPLVLLLGVFHLANDPPAIARTGGDNPPTRVSTLVGHLELSIAVASYGYSSSGEFHVSDMPDDASVEEALFVTGLSTPYEPGNIWLEFDGQGEDLAPAFVDAGGGLRMGGYVSDVSAAVSGNGSYSFRIEPVGFWGARGPLSSLLCVIYEHPELPQRQVQLLLGAESLKHSSSVSIVEDLPGGPARLHLFTQGDEAEIGGTGGWTESIVVNDEIVACCDVFDANQGPWGSYFDLPISTEPGNNAVSISTGWDWLVWHFVGIVADVGVVSTESMSWGRVKTLYR